MIFDIWLVIIALMLVGGVVLRVWQHQLAAVELHKVSASAAAQLVAEFLQSCYDGQFGFPSGLFRIEQAGDNRVIVTEVVERGSHFTKILSGLYRSVLAIGSAFGCIGSVVALCLAVALTPSLIYAALTEIVLRYLLRSRIVADFEPVQDGTKVSFTLRGPAALFVGRRVQHAFHQPVLPVRVAGLAGIALPGAV